MTRHCMALRHLVGLLLLGNAVAAADPDSCGRSEGNACKAGDHSLLHVVSHASVKPAKREAARAALGSGFGGRWLPKSVVGTGQTEQKKDRASILLVEQSALRALAPTLAPTPEPQENRTIANITAAVENRLELLESDVNLLVFGMKQLCGVEHKDVARLKTLMSILNIESLFQETAVEKSRVTDGPGELAKDANNYPTEAMAVNRTLDNISADVSGEVKGVTEVMMAIGKEKDRVSVVGTDVSKRLQTLIRLLSSETQECQMGGQYQPGEWHSAPLMEVAGQVGLAQKGNDDPSELLALLAEKAGPRKAGKTGKARLDLAELKKSRWAGKPQEFPFLQGGNLTLKNVSTSIFKEVTDLEDLIAALVDQKNKLGVADSSGAENLANMEQTVEADGTRAGLLQTNQQISGAEETEETKRERLMAKLSEKHGEEDERAKLMDEIDAPPAPMVSVANSTIANVSEGIDFWIASLEADISTIAWEKHNVCLASAKFFERVSTVVRVLKGVDC